jgi:hypothetical protein
MSDLQSVEQSKTARRENLAKWRANRKHELTLPSGLIVEVRDATMTDLVLAGTLPPALLAEVEKGASGGQADLSRLAGTPDFGKLVNELVKVCVVDPPIADQTDDEHIGLDELTGDDRMAIFTWANREVAAMKEAAFRKEAV